MQHWTCPNCVLQKFTVHSIRQVSYVVIITIVTIFFFLQNNKNMKYITTCLSFKVVSESVLTTFNITSARHLAMKVYQNNINQFTICSFLCIMYSCHIVLVFQGITTSGSKSVNLVAYMLP